jgi:aldose 1-epimerase
MHRTFEGFDAVELAAGELVATFVPGLGMVGASLRHRGGELLDRRAGLAAYARRGEVMGLPLLHPWANRLSAHHYAVGGRRVVLENGSPLVHCEEHGLPIHGLLAGSPHWRVAAVGAAPLRATLDFAAHPELLAAFPFPHELAIEATLTPAALTVATILRGTGDVAVHVSFGFHPYRRLPGADRAGWRLSLPRRRQLATDERGIPTGCASCARPRPSRSAATATTTDTTRWPTARSSARPGAAAASRFGWRPATRRRRSTRRRVPSSSATSR